MVFIQKNRCWDSGKSADEARRMVKQLKNHSYEDRLKVLNLPTHKYRCLRGDMIQVYTIISGVHDSYSSLQFNMSNVSITRGN